MASTYQVLRIFLSSPRDVRDERLEAEKVIREVSETCRDTLGLMLDCIKWESMPPRTPAPPEGGIQASIEEQVKSCHVFVLILNKRYGSSEPGHDRSNTEREVHLALEMLNRNHSLTILSYFKERAPDDDKGAQEALLDRMQDDLRKRHLRYAEFRDINDFRAMLTHALYNTALRFRAATIKRQPLAAFWDLGIAEGTSQPRVAIVYPPVDRDFMPKERPDRIWLRRLAPHVVFEDFKAVDKVTKTLRLLGARDAQAFGTATMPPDVQEYNRVWLCLPRNQPALNQLRTLYASKALFDFVPSSRADSRTLRWRYSSETHNFMTIRSPLSLYLKLQRRHQPGGKWLPRHTRIAARDFAVVARFSDTRDSSVTASGRLKDYFIAGLRGLGTWGAAWALDRRYKLLEPYVGVYDATIQILLEVTYRDGRIHDVIDVSRQTESYFEHQNEPRTVRKVIDELAP